MRGYEGVKNANVTEMQFGVKLMHTHRKRKEIQFLNVPDLRHGLGRN